MPDILFFPRYYQPQIASFGKSIFVPFPSKMRFWANPAFVHTEVDIFSFCLAGIPQPISNFAICEVFVLRMY